MRILLVSASAYHLLELVSDVRLQPDACLLPLTAFSCLILPRPCGTVQRQTPRQVAVSACAPARKSLRISSLLRSYSGFGSLSGPFDLASFSLPWCPFR